MLNTAQTDLQDVPVDATADVDDFLAREKAVLGEDADKFASVEDGAAFDNGDDDLLGGGEEETVQFEQQFPDLSGPTNEVRFDPRTHRTITMSPSNILRSHRQSPLAETSPRPVPP